MGNVIKKADLKVLENFQKFIQSDSGLQDRLNNVLKDKVRRELKKLTSRKPLTTLKNIRTAVGEEEGSIENLIKAIINTSRSIKYMKEMIDGEKFEIDGGEASAMINVSILFNEAANLAGASFMNTVTFSTDGMSPPEADKLMDLLNVSQNGGEVIWDKVEGKEGEKVKYYLNAKRGYHTTTYMENLIAKNLKAYFANNIKDIDKDINDKFDEWLIKNNVKLDKKG